MKILKNIGAYALTASLLFTGCTKDFDEINDNPNDPTLVPTHSLMLNAQKQLMDDIRDEWASGRVAQLISQQWAQVNYTEEDRYEFRTTVNNSFWSDMYVNLMDLKRVIELNTDESTKDGMSAYGANENQIAAAIILKTWAFQVLTDTYGPVPYYSYGSDDADFQGLQAGDGIILPKYAPVDKIYYDMLNELKLAAAMIKTDEKAFTAGDNIYGGDAAKWKKFANSLRLRVAMRMRSVDASTANTHIAEAIADGVFQSNADNASFTYESNDDNGAPMYRAFFVSNRTDFAVAKPLIDLLKGDKGPFGILDPRLSKYADANEAGEFVGQPYGVESSVASGIKVSEVSLPSKDVVLAANFAEMYMSYAEVEFLISEYNGWSQANYVNGVRASMEQWGVAEADIATYLGALPAASQENVLTQKYLSLYMQPYEAWSDYRRTGFPKTLVHPGEVVYTYTDEDGKTVDATFTSLVDGLNDLPGRLFYPNEEQTENGANYQAAVASIGGSDDLKVKLWWDK
jgi:hypothetical protein